MGDLKIDSLNVRGLRSRHKRLKIFTWIKIKHKADFVCLQETHSTLLDAWIKMKHKADIVCLQETHSTLLDGLSSTLNDI